ncbi:2OG-Fe(II) oxygenase superfamily protein [Athelia psychrophila]|uniref:2OG-Fe(II) oxygenase superfamily protein n=1 Tax=Athelia psychrophila TaxID=1759441 RepID=A0A166W1V8_9AGAM|nr:2OG-Fe(II) oxygenase superfamily protein [Fibularhizoctonia sp. CBS 109695]
MPSLINQTPAVAPYTAHPPTTAVLDWAPLATIDLSKFDAPGGKQALAKDLQEAMKRWSFWIVTNTGIPQEDVDRQLSIANGFFQLPIEEKRKVSCDFSVGNYFGYREPTRFIGDSDVKENMETLNIPKFIPEYADVPQHDFTKALHAEIGPFHKALWDKVVRKLMVLFAIILELPEQYFVERHAYDRASEDHLRYLLYHPRSAEEDAKIGDQWSKGHTDNGSLTLLFSQNVAALQIRTLDNEWKWVKPVDGGITCNTADTLSFLTKGYIKSTIHRVVRPPPDQSDLHRLGLLYFVRPGDDVDMVPAPSPVLRREGLLSKEDETGASSTEPVKGLEWVRTRVKNIHNGKAFRGGDKDGVMFSVKNLQVQDYYQ